MCPFLCLQSLLAYCSRLLAQVCTYPSRGCPSFLSDPFSSEGNFHSAFLHLCSSPVFVLAKHLIFTTPPVTAVASAWVRPSSLAGARHRLLFLGTHCSTCSHPPWLAARWTARSPLSLVQTCVGCSNWPGSHLSFSAPLTTSCSLIIIPTKLSGTSS